MPPDGKHLPMHHMNINTWAAGIVSKEPEIDSETPPNTKHFDVTHNDPTDLSLLSRRRQLSNQSNQASSSPNVVINNDFKDLAAMIGMPSAPRSLTKGAASH
ncbi:hypothetical protein FIBSPDRAFT_950175 [Athelia psychrophila]|uniref:Uncharacterized protein n=1 Tax=Athelia psychrophila TaxID=1759441 RepID=A0A166NXB5_9AGAM|nr:hypothetical protein FIBSPDRAFT_950175 [Fibularhizoctonia sp. CBS 109695]